MPNGSTSRASDSMKPSSPNFDAAYAAPGRCNVPPSAAVRGRRRRGTGGMARREVVALTGPNRHDDAEPPRVPMSPNRTPPAGDAVEREEGHVLGEHDRVRAGREVDLDQACAY